MSNKKANRLTTGLGILLALILLLRLMVYVIPEGQVGYGRAFSSRVCGAWSLPTQPRTPSTRP